MSTQETEVKNQNDVEKQEKAKKIASRLLKANDLEREGELSILDEDDAVLAGMVRNELDAMTASELAQEKSGSVKVVRSMADIEKLPPEEQAVMKGFVNELGGTMPSGGLIQIKMDSVEAIKKTADALVSRGLVNMNSVIVSKLVAARSAQIVSAVAFMIDKHDELMALLPDMKAAEQEKTKALLATMDKAIDTAFGQQDYNLLVQLHVELVTAASQPKPRGKPGPKPGPKKGGRPRKGDK